MRHAAKPIDVGNWKRPVNLRAGHAHLNGEPDAWAKIGEPGGIRVCRRRGCSVHVTPRRICSQCHTETEAL